MDEHEQPSWIEQAKAGEAVRSARVDRGRFRGRSSEEIKALRKAAAETASICADCFEPLPPYASVTRVNRFFEHIPAGVHCLGLIIKAHDRYLPVPICLGCWLSDIAQPSFCFRGGSQDGHLDWASPTAGLDGYEFRRLRCEGCARPLRVLTRRYRRLPLRLRCCCFACQHKAVLRKANERRRVRHDPQACVECGKMFTPAQSTARTCSNTCRQRQFRQRHAAH